jgi:hypothetical protein
VEIVCTQENLTSGTLDKRGAENVVKVITNNDPCLPKGTFLLIPQGLPLRLRTASMCSALPATAQVHFRMKCTLQPFTSLRPISFSDVYISPRGHMQHRIGRLQVKLVYLDVSPPTRSRRSTGSGGESSSMLTSVEGNAVQGRMLL